MTYHLRVTDRAGCSYYVDVADFSTLLVHARGSARRMPDDTLSAFNKDRCDYDTNGLTDEESEQFDDAVREGRDLAKGIDRVDIANDLHDLAYDRSGVSDDEAREQEDRP